MMRRYFRLVPVLIGLLALAALATAHTSVAAASNDISGAVTQSYNADPSVLAGMVVGLNPKDPTTVQPLASGEVGRMTGVVVPVNDATISLTPQAASTQQVLVASAGRYNLLVSDQNGAIKTGDYLTISSLSGIAMKADSSDPEIVGQSIENFTGNNALGRQQLKNSAGHNQTVAISHLSVNVRLAPNPLYTKNNSLPSILSKAANAVSGKSVAPARVYLSVAVLLATIFIAGSIFYGSVRSGVASVGRNPLAKKAIGRTLLQTTAAGLVILLIGVFTVYLILNV